MHILPGHYRTRLRKGAARADVTAHPDLSPPAPYAPALGDPCAREPMGCDGRVRVEQGELKCPKCGWKVSDER